MLQKTDAARPSNRDGLFRELLLAATAMTVCLCGVPAAFAQEAAPPSPAQEANQENEGDEVVVTASRAARSGYQAPTPTSVVRAETIDRQAAVGIGELLVQNPAFKGTRNPNANATNTSSPGQWTADLRGLGGQRSLVLVDGARIVPFAPASNLSVPTTTDLNLIPTLMIDRVEVVTGGASAQYGSDAVAGVVNIILKREFDGFRVRAQSGVSQEGDAEETRAGFVAGWNFADERAHLVISADYVDSEGVRDIYTRDWGRQERMIVSNPGSATNGLPALIIADNVHNALGAGGVIAGPANFSLRGQTFNPDGSLRPFQFGSIVGGAVMIGGEGTATITGTDLVPRVERMATYGRFGYDFTDDLHGYFSAAYSESTGDLTGVPPRLVASQITIRDDNAFLPTQVRDAMAAEGIPSFTMTRIGHDIGVNRYVIENKSPRFSAGLEGDFAETWDWDAHVSYGRNDYASTTLNNPITNNLRFAIDAVVDPVSGAAVCRATLPGPAFNAAAAGCVPINLFGEGSPSAGAIAYVAGSGLAEVDYEQTAAAANLRGEPFSTWAGPISASAGIEYRKETGVVTADPIAAANGFLTAGNAVPWDGEYSVTEGYVEAIAPLARDMAFAQLIDLNAAIRYADYSTAGGQTAWKIGAVWEPTEWLRFRATQSRDIRAPALNELYSPGSNVRNTVNVRNSVTDQLGNFTITQNTSLGNPDLEPEIADTTTYGFVLRPIGGPFEGLNLSVDYYRIDLAGAITNLSTANIAGLCNNGNAFFCGFFTFDAAGAATSLTAPALNLGGFVSSGYDIAIDYSRDLGPGTFEVNFTGAYVEESVVDTGIGPAVDRAGENGAANFGAVPTYRGNITTTYRMDDWSASLQAVFTSDGALDNLYNTPAGVSVTDNSVPSYVLFNLYGHYNLTDRVRVFGAIENLLDRDPAATPYAILNAPVFGAYYDKIGRQFSLGVDLRF